MSERETAAIEAFADDLGTLATAFLDGEQRYFPGAELAVAVATALLVAVAEELLGKPISGYVGAKFTSFVERLRERGPDFSRDLRPELHKDLEEAERTLKTPSEERVDNAVDAVVRKLEQFGLPPGTVGRLSQLLRRHGRRYFTERQDD